VTVDTNLPDTDLGADGQSNSQSQSQRVEETVNFEISRVVKTHVRESGVVRRLSVAILVNGATSANEAGEAIYTPRPQDELDQLAALARSSIGFDQERGDVLEIVNMPFADLESGEAGSPIWDFFGLSQGTLLRILELGVLGLVAILALLFVIRPLMGRLLEAQGEEPVAALPGGSSAALAQGEAGAVQAIAAANAPALEGPSSQAQESHAELERMIDLNMVDGRVRESSMKKIGEIVDKHPEEAASIIRSWLFEQA
jgi:flagellar M-ring protein FliF